MNCTHYLHGYFVKHSSTQIQFVAQAWLSDKWRYNRRDVIQSSRFANFSGSHAVLRLGFVPLTDCAPLVMAHELGIFHKFGLRVTLHRELGWASIRDKIIYGELEAAHAIAAMPVAATLGLGSIRCDCLTGLVLNLHGNAITLSNALWVRGIRDGVTLRDEIKRLRSEKVFTFGVVYPFSSHRYLLQRWLMALGIDPKRDVRIVVVPPAQMVANLKTGNLDGFCVGEPWNSVAADLGLGWCAATTAEIDPGHPEKVLMVRREFAEKREEEHLRMVAALIEACAYCDREENREHIVATLAQPAYINVPHAVLQGALKGSLDTGNDRPRHTPDFCIFRRNGANEPGSDKAAWVLQLVRSAGLSNESTPLNFDLGRRVFRADIYDQALAFAPSTPIHTDHEIEKRFAIA
jgi:ABC-type nitrate/sulfonate/bicarbonate transport system substrate-binding protein